MTVVVVIVVVVVVVVVVVMVVVYFMYTQARKTLIRQSITSEPLPEHHSKRNPHISCICLYQTTATHSGSSKEK